MSEEIEKILNDYLTSPASFYSKIIPQSRIDNIVNRIVELYSNETKRINSVEIENEKLKAQIEMKDNLLNMYENIISKSNFSMILDKKKKENTNGKEN